MSANVTVKSIIYGKKNIMLGILANVLVTLMDI